MVYTIIGADGQQYGPVTADQLREWITEGRANARTQILAGEAGEWKPLGQLPEFSPALAESGSRPPPVHPVPGVIGPVATAPRNNPLAVAGLVLGVISVTLGLCCCYGLPFNVLGILFSAVGLSQIRADPASQRGRELALVGLALCILSLVIGVLFVLFSVAPRWSEIWEQIQH